MTSPNTSKRQTWLITGAAGFIGSNLAMFLLRSGQNVIGFDNFETGTQTNVDRVLACGQSGFRMIVGDIRDKDAVAAAMSGIDKVVHLAAQVSVPRSMDDPVHDQSVNAGGFLNVLTAAADAGVRNFVFASSCAVYGDNQAIPLKESEVPRPASPYAFSKSANEFYAALLGPNLNGMIPVGLRFFNVFGPWQNPDGGYASVIPRWLKLCMNNQQPEIFGDGTATRDFCFVGDVCRAIEIGGNLDIQPSKVVFNVGSGVAADLINLFDTIKQVLEENGYQIDFDGPTIGDERLGDILHSCADVTLAYKELGFRAQVLLKDGLREILKLEFGQSS